LGVDTTMALEFVSAPSFRFCITRKLMIMRLGVPMEHP
jgi:hypothetical protein